MLSNKNKYIRIEMKEQQQPKWQLNATEIGCRNSIVTMNDFRKKNTRRPFPLWIEFLINWNDSAQYGN